MSAETASGISNALARSLNPYAAYAAVVALLAPLAGKGTIPPEVFGSAQLYVNGVPGDLVQFNKPWQQDSYTPILTTQGGCPTWTHVPFGPNIRIIGNLWDKDLVEDDAIGPFDINYSQIEQALQQNGLYPVRIDRTILFIRLSVMAEQ